MKKGRYITSALPAAVDIGNASIKVLVADVLSDDSLELLGVGEVASEGIAEGVIVDIEKVVKNLSEALREAEIMSERHIERALISVSGEHVYGQLAEGSAVISDNNVTVADIEKVHEMARAAVSEEALRVLMTQHRDYEIDGQKGIRQPLGMAGRRLMGEMHLVVTKRQVLENMEKCIIQAGVRAAGNFIFSGLAAEKAVLTNDEKELGVCLVDMGAGTTEVTIFVHGVVHETHVFAMAGDDIHRDIAHMHHASLEDAERVKREVGVIATDGEDAVSLSDVGGGEDNRINKAVVRDTIDHRVDEILDNIATITERFQAETKLKLSAGLVVVGDTARLPGLSELMRQKLRLGIRIGLPRYRGKKHELVAAPRFAVGIGLLMMATAIREKPAIGVKGFFNRLRNFFDDND